MLPNLLRHLRKVPSILTSSKRTLLPESYRCDPEWKSRLSHEAFASVYTRDLGLNILQSINTKEEVSRLDYDIFTNKLHELDVISLDFIENIIEKYSHTQSALDVMDSSSHAIIRAYMDFKQPHRLLELLRKRADMGVFLDSVSANLILDNFSDEKDWLSALNVVWELCLQEHFSQLPSSEPLSAVTVALALNVCAKLIDSGLPREEAAAPVDEESDDVEYRVVKYIRNPSYDSFFDIDRPRLKLGFTLLHLDALFTGHPEAFCAHSPSTVADALRVAGEKLTLPVRLFGLAYSEQLGQLAVNLARLTSPEQLELIGLSKQVLDRLVEVIEAQPQLRPDGEAVKRGEPNVPTTTEHETALLEAKRLQDLGQPSETDFFTACHQFAHNGILTNSDCLASEQAHVQQLYQHFTAKRAELWTESLARAKESRVIGEAKHAIRELLDKEELLNYFRKEDDVLRQAWLAPRTRKERRWSQRKDAVNDIRRLGEREQGERAERHAE